ncbi:MAG TPA: carbon starvation CstA family protein, partial [Planctomycetia bacterium]|nr:carbon starvation CstA family protein [Planctomycetia bacterium]
MPQLALVHIVAISGVALAVAYVVYGRILVRLLQLDDRRPTPAVEMKDDVDYVPTERKFLLGQHFSAIAAAGPIVGPILAGVAFGWLPALLWILIGSIFIGGVHDITALVASIRHRARSIPEVVREHMSGRAYLLFLAFVWLCLVYIIVAFTDVTASSFIGVLKLDEATAETSAVVAASSSAPIPEKSAETAVTPAAPSIVVSGPGIASSSLMYLLLPIAMGLLLRYRKLSVGVATAVFLPLVAFAIWYGQKIPLDVQSWLGLSDVGVRRFWNAALLVYCCIASVLPAWLLLQPRGHLGGYFLYAALIAGAVGVTIGGTPVRYPAFIGWESAAQGPLFPFLFITIACSACSGFHSIIASGTTSK